MRRLGCDLLAIVLALIGIVLTIGGAWLVILGGSPYYLIAGIAMLASAWFLFRGRLLGGWIYIGLFVLSAIWGFAESRGNGWAMIPWLVAPLVLLIFVLLVMPTLTARAQPVEDGGRRDRRRGALRDHQLRGARQCGDTAAAALPAQSSPGMADPSGSRPAPTGRPMAAPTPRGGSRR